jgi:hypothetical protein
MKNWKTTLCGTVGALGQIFPLIGLPQEIGQAVSVIGISLLALFSKDSNVTGGTVQQS